MKKSLLCVFSLFLLLTLVFTACKQPVNNDAKITSLPGLHALPAPNVRATGYGPTGVIRVSWDPVANANGYDLYRKSVAGNGKSAVVFLASFSHNTTLTYDDQISDTNEFIVGTKYSYLVVAYSNWSSNDGSGGVGTIITNNEELLVLQNSSKESSAVTFSSSGSNALLGRGMSYPAPKNLKIVKAIQYNTTGNPGDPLNGYDQTDVIRATWKAEPGVRYHVSYGISDGLTKKDPKVPLYFAQIVTPPVGSFNVETLEYDLPIIYGNVTVQVAAIPLAGDTYYEHGKPASASLNVTETYLPTPNIVNVFFQDAESVLLVWEMEEAESYKIYRFVTNDSTYVINDDIFVYDSWKNITNSVWKNYDPAYDYHIAIDSIQDLLPLQLANAQIYYMIIGEKSKAVSLPAMATITNTYKIPDLSATNIGWDAHILDWQGIRLWWTPNPNETYKLYRAVYNVFETQTPTYQEVSLANINVAADGSHGLIDTPAYRNSYMYKLETYGANGKLLGTTYDEVDTLPYYPYIYEYLDLSVTVNPDNLPTAADPDIRAPAYEMGYYISHGSLNNEQFIKLVASDESIKISRTQATGGNVEIAPYEQVGTLISASDIDFNKEYLDNPGPGRFQYKIEVVRGNTVLFTPYFQPAAVSAPTNIGAAWISLNRNTVGSVSTIEVIGAGTTDRINGTKVFVRYANGSSQAIAQDKVLNNNFQAEELTVTRDGNTGNAYSFNVTTAVALSWYIQVYYQTAAQAAVGTYTFLGDFLFDN
ncbi:MAG: hypothetical protein FWH41_04255 [Treponema sp.]|nr:hypothetical protein [Treponema sp.]